MYELIRLLMPLCNQFQTILAKYKEKKQQCSNSTLKRGLKNVYSLKKPSYLYTSKAQYEKLKLDEKY